MKPGDVSDVMPGSAEDFGIWKKKKNQWDEIWV